MTTKTRFRCDDNDVDGDDGNILDELPGAPSASFSVDKLSQASMIVYDVCCCYGEIILWP